MDNCAACVAAIWNSIEVTAVDTHVECTARRHYMVLYNSSIAAATYLLVQYYRIVEIVMHLV